MTLEQSLEIVVASTGHERLRWLTSDLNPNAVQRDKFRAQVIRQAADESPSPLRQAANALSALSRAAGQLASGGPLTVSSEEQARRLAICRDCPEFQSAGPKCRKCGCNLQLKTRLSSETGQCPLGKW
jgi:hypothetical protein